MKVDYSANQVALWHSTGSDQLTQVVPLSSTSVSDSDWHVGILRLPLNGVQVSLVFNMINNDINLCRHQTRSGSTIAESILTRQLFLSLGVVTQTQPQTQTQIQSQIRTPFQAQPQLQTHSQTQIQSQIQIQIQIQTRSQEGTAAPVDLLLVIRHLVDSILTNFLFCLI